MKYGLIENILPVDTCTIVCKSMLEDPNFKTVDTFVNNCKSFYCPSYLMVLSPIIQIKLEEYWNKTLSPTYTYSRILYPGSDLKPHIDRPSCEYSVSITMGHNYDFNFYYPIYMSGKPINVPVSYGITYLGCEIEHWREPLVGVPDNFWIQAFFHYVDINGKHTQHMWDQAVDRYK